MFTKHDDYMVQLTFIYKWFRKWNLLPFLACIIGTKSSKNREVKSLFGFCFHIMSITVAFTKKRRLLDILHPHHPYLQELELPWWWQENHQCLAVNAWGHTAPHHPVGHQCETWSCHMPSPAAPQWCHAAARSVLLVHDSLKNAQWLCSWKLELYIHNCIDKNKDVLQSAFSPKKLTSKEWVTTTDLHCAS